MAVRVQGLGAPIEDLSMNSSPFRAPNIERLLLEKAVPPINTVGEEL